MPEARKIPQNPRKVWNVDSKPYDFRGTRQGETVRTCERCGAEYVPNMRVQRYCCKECRYEAEKERKHG